jgi:hypothetical protein
MGAAGTGAHHLSLATGTGALRNVAPRHDSFYAEARRSVQPSYVIVPIFTRREIRRLLQPCS